MPNLSAPQSVFLNGLDTKYRAFVGGYGSGKTYVGCLDQLIFFSRHPGVRQGYFAPSYPLIRDVFFPTLEEAAHSIGFDVDIKEGNKEIHIFRGGRYYGTTICRSMDRPSSIVGFKVARALVDEIDTMPENKASQAWNKIVARLRLKIDGVENGVGVTTTPEGFRFVYKKFKQSPTSSYSMVQASTYENEKNLPDDYIPSLMETYPSELVQAYLNGDFVNLTSGTVYYAYDRIRHGSNESIVDGEPLFIGQDFNVGNMASTVFVSRSNGYHVVDELTGIFDTPSLIDTLKERFAGHHITIYPDASGNSRKTSNASISDISLIKSNGFAVKAKKTNPAVKDRINAVNKALQDNRIFVNHAKCPNTANCLEQQVYDKNGEPDKTGGNDHQNDATGYFIAFEMPVVRPLHTPILRMAR